MKATVIMSNLEPQGNLLTVLYALCTQDFPQGEYEVILPDLKNITPSEAAIATHLSRQYPHFRVLRGNTKNRSVMINEAARQARGEFLLFIESHCIPPNDWVANHVRLHETKNVDAVLGHIATVPTHVQSAQAESEMLHEVYRRMKAQGTAKSFFDFHNSSISKKCFDELGGFDEGLPHMMEFELGARLHQRKKRVHNAADFNIWHNTDASFDNYSTIITGQGRDRGRMIQRFGVPYMNEYFPMPRFLALLPFFKVFRVPALMAATALMHAGAFGFAVAEKCRLGKRVTDFFFGVFSKCSLRRGILQGLKKSEVRRRER